MTLAALSATPAAPSVTALPSALVEEGVWAKADVLDPEVDEQAIQGAVVAYRVHIQACCIPWVYLRILPGRYGRAD